MALMLLPLDEDLTSFFTILSVQGKEVPFSFFNVPSPSALGGKSCLKDVKIKCDIEIRGLLLGFEALLQLRLNESADLPSFILELKDILENIGLSSTNAFLQPAKYYKIILAEIDSIGWNNLAHVGSDLMEISFRIFDKAGREHIVQVSLPINYPNVPPVASADLPCTLEFNWHKDANITTLLQQYEEAIGRYQEFWAVMEDIDKKFWIMEPENPSRSNTFRRIAIGNHCSLSVTVNPLSPYSIPECRFFGSDMTIGPIRKKLGNNIHKWNRAKFLTENLVEVLEIVFPLREENTEDDISGNCGICYGFRLFDDEERSKDAGKEGSIPDRVCDNGNCGRPFHTNCLVEWLRSITTTRQSFDVLFGNCPYCSHPIAVKSGTST